MAWSISSFPSDLPCTSSEHIMYSGRIRGSPNNSRLEKYTESPSAAQHEQFSAIEYSYKPASVEDSDDTESLPTSVENAGTVIHTPYRKSTALQVNRNESILGYDPLSSFTVYPKDKPQNQEPSYVQERAYPTTLRQAHGTFALQNDNMVQAITDAARGELDWDKISALDLSGKNLTTLHNLDKYCPSLRTLKLDNNNLEHLIGIPKSVRILSVNDNCLSSLTSFDHLPNLQFLHAARNKLENLNALRNLDHLQEISVCSNKITDIIGISMHLGLRTLDVSHNYIERVPWSNWLLQRLTKLNMSYNHLWCIDALTALPRLQQLDLEGNGINSFNEGCDEKHLSIQSINLKGNSVMNLDLLWLPNVQDLNLEGNLIMAAKALDGLENAIGLNRLSLRAQQDSRQGHVNDLVNTILNTRLECSELCLSENVVPKGCLTMPLFKHHNIRKLELAQCGMEWLPQYFGQYFPNCRILNLNFNDINEVDELRGCDNLQELHLARNQITSLKDTVKIMGCLPRLRSLDLRNNCANNGWYNTKPGCEVEYKVPSPSPYELGKRQGDTSSSWHKKLSSNTKYRRMVMHLLLAKYCYTLSEFDGAVWTPDVYLKDKRLRQELVEHGYETAGRRKRPADPDVSKTSTRGLS